MLRKVMPLLIFGSFVVTYADFEIQTDWTGGPGVLGPVLTLGVDFHTDTDIEWSSTPGIIHLTVPTEHMIENSYWGVRSVYAEDFDGDGDLDVLSSSALDDNIVWWKNVDGVGRDWQGIIIAEYFNSAQSAHAEDLNGDGYMDVIGAARDADRVTWWSNNGSGTYWIENNIDSDFDGAYIVYSEDIDDDGDMDVLGAASEDDAIAWWENVDGSGSVWNKRIIDGSFDFASFVYSEDIDGDGDMDVLGTASYMNTIAWWENVDGLGTSWVKHVVDSFIDHPICVHSEDIDGDGDMDVLGAGLHSYKVYWWENDDGSGVSWTRHTITSDYFGCYTVHSGDLDNDGDMDVAGCSMLQDKISWWENEDGAGSSWTEHTVSNDNDMPWDVFLIDIDDNGNLDILTTSLIYCEIAWWDITPAGILESSILFIQEDPYWDFLYWNAQTPAETSVLMQVRSSDDHTNMGAWSDTLPSSCSLVEILDDCDRYVQYRALLQTSDPETTPALNDVTISWNPLSIEGTAEPFPQGPVLLKVTPNPTAGSPVISFGLPEDSYVEIAVFDLSGRLVDNIITGEYSSGYHDVQIHGLLQGIYFCRMHAGDFTAAHRFVVIE